MSEVIENQRMTDLQNELELGGRIGVFYNTFAVTSGATLERLAQVDQALLDHARLIGTQFEYSRSPSKYLKQFFSGRMAVPM